ncbi:MAG: DUF1192 domain-containing protein [Alphaproteobacteria bacterium]
MNDDTGARNGPAQKKPAYMLGIDLSQYSVEEIEETITACKAEIARLKDDLQRKRGSIAAADAIFKS